jgi:hypothetical protein
MLRFSSFAQDEMLKPSAEYSASRPFKIFVSLLDKDEIGIPLTEALVFDAFRALRKNIESDSDLGEEVSYGAQVEIPLILVFTDENDCKHAIRGSGATDALERAAEHSYLRY